MRRQSNSIPAYPIRISAVHLQEDGHKKWAREDIKVLASDMENNGQIYPIIVTALAPENGEPGKKNAHEAYHLKAGYGRLMAAKSIGWESISAIVIPTFENAIIDEFVKLIESCYSNNVGDYELAKAACEMEDKYKITGQEFAVVVGLSNGYTYNLKRWFRNVPSEIKQAWRTNNIHLNQAELERYSHMETQEKALNAWHKRLLLKEIPTPFQPGKKPIRTKATDTQKHRRASERQLMNLQEAIDNIPLIPEVKDLCTSIVRFVLGVSKTVPGITDYKKLPLNIITEAAKEIGKVKGKTKDSPKDAASLD